MANNIGFNKEGVKVTDVPNTGFKIIQFQDASQPVFQEKKGQPYIMYGEKNDYPNYLLYLFNNSAKHSAIINGKVDYIIGKGWSYEKEGTPPDQQAILDAFIKKVNAKGESLKAVMGKLAVDLELFNGGYLNIVWNVKQEIASIYHLDYTTVRSNKDNTEFYVSDEWVKYDKTGTYKQNQNPDYKNFCAYNEDNKEGSQILYVKNYHPGIDIYTLPNYRGSITWLEVDVEIGAYHLNNVKGGFFANKLINFNNGTPTAEGQAVIEKMFTDRYAGTRARKFILAFNNDSTRAATVTDLNVSESDKIFDLLNKTGQQEIFTGHRITSPILFGIKTEGQLGGRSEIRDSYEIFKNTYVNGRQQTLEEVINMLSANNGITTPLLIQPTEPISFEFSEATQAQNMSKDEIREKMGLAPVEDAKNSAATDLINALNSLSPLVANKVLENLTSDEIRGVVGLAPAPPGTLPTASGSPAQPAPVQQAHQFNKQELEEDEKILAMFARVGKPRGEHLILKSKKVRFESNKDEELHFAGEQKDIQVIQQQILELIKKDPLVTMQVLSDALKVDIDTVTAAVADLVDRKLLSVNDKIVDGEKIAERTPAKDAVKKVSVGLPEVKSISVKYSYDGPEDRRNRPFCAKMMALDRLYTRREIEQISGHLGFSVWARRGGWYTDPVTNEHRPYCRHSWVSHVVVTPSN